MNMTAPDSLPSARGHAQSRRVELLWLLALLIALAFAFQGSRGLWGTDEGRYTNVALRMLNSGDYLFPSLNDEEPHFSKPPLTYWAIAESVRLLGRNEWAARLPNALAFIGTGLLMYGLGLRLTPGRPWLPALIYVTSLGPFVAANVITTDTLLTLWETLAVFAFVAAWFSDDAQRRRRYLLLMWCGFGLAFATKGPPGLLPLLPIAVLRWSYPSSSPPVVSWPGLAAFVVIGFSWFAAVIWARPELLGYFLGYEVYDRLFTSVQDRNPQWYGALQTYGMAFLIGTLPWLILMIRPLMQSWRLVTPRFWRERRDRDPAVFFLLLWLLLPLAVFCVAQSRLL
ncbi:MAG TPA: glycosyltransferase family 39 protein, partial [Gammaproteobacteria bacterium]|nr:glycosyltransferase family 39 protein [Gammaproteobacteria bacterium]